MSVPDGYGVSITELAAHSVYYKGETASLAEVLNFAEIDFFNSPADDLINIDGVSAEFIYEPFNNFSNYNSFIIFII